MRRRGAPALAAALTLATVACPGPSAPVKVWILDYNTDDSQWKLDVSTLDTVEDLNILTGRDFDLVGNQSISVDNLEIKKKKAEDATPEWLKRFVIERGGEPVQLSYDMVSKDGGEPAAMPNDFESLAMLTVFHHFEKVWTFYRDVVGDQSAATHQEMLVGFYATYGAKLLINIPLLTADNAAFVPMSDSFVVLRIQDFKGIPLALNSGIITHEFSHRVFHHNVYMGAGFSNWFQHVLIDSDENLRTQVLLKALDEGTADIHGVGFARRPDFIADSVKGSAGETIRVQRNLEGPFADWATYTRLRTESWSSDSGDDVCGGSSDDYSTTQWNYYCLGTVWARALWDAAGRDIEVLRAELLPAVNRSLGEVGAHLATAWDFDFDVMLEATASDDQLSTARRGALCAAFVDKFQDPDLEVPTCW